MHRKLGTIIKSHAPGSHFDRKTGYSRNARRL